MTSVKRKGMHCSNVGSVSVSDS